MTALAGPPASRVNAIALALCLCVVAGSTPRIVGDGGEYLTQALNFASGEGPAIAEADVPALEARVVEVSPALAEWSIASSAVRDHRGRYDFLHFWFYALLATPFVWLCRAAGANPIVAFLGLNLVLFMTALRIAAPRLGAAGTLLLFGSPIIWWLDKPHTEVLTFSMLVIGFVCLRERPWWSLTAFGAAASQNPPLAALVVGGFVAQWPRGRVWLLDRRLLAGLAAGTALALLHPVYTWDRHGTATLLLAAATPGAPTLPEMLAFVVDPVIGLVPNYPGLPLAALLGAVLIWRERRASLGAADLLLAAFGLVVLLVAFGRTSNFHHGATPSISRYAVWLAPLAVPLLWRARAVASDRWHRAVWPLALASALVNVFIFHPAVPENAREPTWLAAWLWESHPGWSNPLPEIFAETVAGSERPHYPVATAGCEKILTIGRGDAGVWPIPCYPMDLPLTCRGWGAPCYANRLAGPAYAFADAPGRFDVEGLIDRARVWPREAEPHVRAVFEDMAWRELAPDGPGHEHLRAAEGVATWTLAAAGRLLVVLREPIDGAVLRMRTPGPMSGRLIDARTGSEVARIDHRGPPHSMWRIDVPPAYDTLLLALRDGAS